MTSQFLVRPLRPDQVLQAYPLVRALDSALTPEQWQDHVEKAAASLKGGEAGDVMTLQTASGYIHALFVYRVLEDITHGRTLEVDHIIVFDLPGQSTAFEAIVRIMEQVARERDCPVLNIQLPQPEAAGGPPGDRLADLLSDDGYQPSSMRWSKRIGSDE
ncbi:MAG: hypothetical protein QF578_23030 [Alphaproteobacteria bacterium]|jgi:hypothetical protein|nr:hypothetical protein [Alphaproteobacteria bacterium]MDP6567720.1 hypothetical protein [Alphaproteobacteria bacterium]MDP6812722.1 hypothetical protein [Alphaproteobacteria bacterium]